MELAQSHTTDEKGRRGTADANPDCFLGHRPPEPPA